ncbi:MAG: sigma-70 family RNA polymerase sigma factor [Clostridia bacterium]|nr:sigma-70 family RNA polymerase sigma factor [Clostridia bacterium]
MLLIYTLHIEEENDRIKFEKIYSLYKNKMWYAANQILSDAYLSEDAVHNAFIGIAKNIKRISSADSQKALSYCITAAKNAAIDILRKNKGIQETDIDGLYDISDKKSSSFYEVLETKDIIEKAVAALPTVYRDVLYLLIAEQMSEKEIAGLLGRRPGTVHQQVKRGRKILQEEIMKGAKINGDK